jgi:hypothetical protein
MRVTFTKDSERRYTVAVDRDREPGLLPRHGPGNDPYLPHDIAQLLVEIEFGIRLGVFGQLAAGAVGIFAPVSRSHALRTKRIDERIGVLGRADMERSEKLTHLCVSEWERRVGRRRALPATVDVSRASGAEVDAAVAVLADAAPRWHRLPIGGSVGYEWPARLTVDPARTHRGRRVRHPVTDRR